MNKLCNTTVMFPTYIVTFTVPNSIFFYGKIKKGSNKKKSMDVIKRKRRFMDYFKPLIYRYYQSNVFGTIFQS